MRWLYSEHSAEVVDHAVQTLLRQAEQRALAVIREHQAPGVYHYHPDGHRLQQTESGDQRHMLARAALAQPWVKAAAAVVVVTAVYDRTTRKYGERGIRYVHMEVGHAAQNLFLQAEALGLATVVVGAFEDDAVATVLKLPTDVQPLMLLPVARR